MSIVKSFAVGDGDMFYIHHNTDNFTVIDCCNYRDGREIDLDLLAVHLDEIKQQSQDKGISRFISTHPDDDHIGGLTEFCKKIGISNFYCVANETTKTDETEDFNKYCELRDDPNKHFYLSRGCRRKWMNESDNERKGAGLHCLWPITSNEYYKTALKEAKEGKSPNNISPIFTYSLEDGAKIMWMGDLEKDFIEKIQNVVSWEKIDILFAPHHGRDSGKLPEDILKKLNPKIIVIGGAPSEDLNYYNRYNTITQNSAGDIVFECVEKKVHIFVSKENYSVNFLIDEQQLNRHGTYIGTLNIS